MADHVTFGECLRELMRRKGITTSQLTRQLNFKSNNMIARILRDECSYAATAEFLDSLQILDALLFSYEELGALRVALDVTRVGKELYPAYQRLWRLFRAASRSQEPVVIQPYGSDCLSLHTLEELLAYWRGMARIEFHVANCCRIELFDALGALMRARPEPGWLSVYHALQLNDQPLRTVRALEAILPLISSPDYHGYYTGSIHRADEAACIDGSLCFLRLQDPDGRQLIQIMMPVGERRYTLYTQAADPSLWQMLRYSFCASLGKHVPVHTPYPNASAQENLMLLAERRAVSELDRTLYLFKPDLGINCIPPEVLARALWDSPQWGVGKDSAEFQQLNRYQVQRYDNLFHKRPPSYMTLQLPAMRAFAHTGRLTNHLESLRPFTPAERVQILSHLMEASCSLPRFHLYFLPESANLRQMELDCYDGLGILITSSSPLGMRDAERCEALITIDELTKLIENFFQNELLERCALPEARTPELLRALIAQVPGA